MAIMKIIAMNTKSRINLNNTHPRQYHMRNVQRDCSKRIRRQKPSQIRFGFRKFLDASDVADVEGRHVEDRSRFRADTMAKASTLGSIVTVRRTTCWILKQTLPLSLSACAFGGEKGGCNRQWATIALATFMGVAMRMKRDANSDTLTVSLET